MVSTQAFTQTKWQVFNQEKIDINKKGMLILGGWAVGNIALGAIASSRTSGDTKYFHQMNMYWNVVNIGLAGISYYTALRTNTQISFLETMHEQHKLEKIFLVNAALDVAYMAGGAYMIERGKNRLNGDRLKGFGKSIIMQGAFLLVFDVAMYGIHQHHGKKLDATLEKISFSATENGVGLVVKL